ncbi:MAG: hypothetical protein IH989_04140, partial [Planctomycetes bacterium]|nr:hypothetical protein [Planctomycetota bacterium]
ENDVWYDWTAPATGRVSAETCDGLSTPDTSLVLYNGCDCPAEFGNELACSETEVTGDCLLGSRVTARVQGGRCYKFRLGGNFGGTPSGTLSIDFAPCPPGPITAVDPPNFAIDARAPLDPLTQLPLGIDSFTIKWTGGTGGTTDKFCYSYCETLVDGFAPNDIFGPITNHGDDTFTVNLARPLAPGAFGTLTAKHGDDTTSQVSVISLPGDADRSASVDMADLDFLVTGLNGSDTFNKYRHDMDHSGAFTPRDLLRWLDLASGLPGAFDPWLSAPLPSCDPCCPSEGCIGMEGSCLEGHNGICVGGTHDGEPCDPGATDQCGGWIGGKWGSCSGTPGCADPGCCTQVCEIKVGCCSSHWSQSCANIALQICK